MDKTTLYLPRDLHLALRETARRQGRSQADVARDAIHRYVAADGSPQPRSIGAFEQDPAVGERVPARQAGRWVRQRWGAQARKGVLRGRSPKRGDHPGHLGDHRPARPRPL